MRRLPFAFALALAILFALVGSCSQTPDPTLDVTPATATLTAGDGTQTFTATLQNSSDTITWALDSAVGTIAPATGAETTYTPPATLAATTTVTLTATAGSLTASATITVTPPTPAITVAPATATVTAGGANQAFTATLQNSSDTITWALDPAVGTINPASGTTTTYTPPATLAATTTVTLTATAGTLTDSAVITVNPEAGPATITVNGRVTKFNGTDDGDPAVGVEVRIHDSAGITISTADAALEPQRATDSQGNFTLEDVTPPYTLSVVPPSGPLDDLPQTWTGVNRTDPTVVISPLTGAVTPCAAFSNAGLTVTLNTTVPVGNTGTVYFIAPGIDHRQALSNVVGTIPAGFNSVTLTVPFSQFPCQATVSGKVVYIERVDATGVIAQTGDADTTVTTGNPQFVDVTIDSPNTTGIQGDVTFPVGTAFGSVVLVAKVGDASAFVEIQDVNLVDPAYDISAPTIPGVQYRTLALSSSFPIGDKLSWAYSDVVAPGALDVDLEVPSLGATTVPFGTIYEVTPEFVYNQISGTNLNYTFVINDVASPFAAWLGATTEASITLPQLPAPARLAAGTAATPNPYLWFALNSVNVRAGGDADTMLDGRQEPTRHFFFDALYNPDDISAGSINYEPTPFAVAP